MGNFSENTFGARIANAEALLTHLKAFTTYAAPTTDTSTENYEKLIQALKAENAGIATKKLAYSTAVDTRSKHFFKEPTSVDKLVSPITAAVKAKLGKSAKQVTDITALGNKIRGEKPKKATTPPVEGKEAEKKDTVSQSERSYGSITKHFADIINTLTALGTDYTPANDSIKIATLTAKLETIKTANNQVTATYGALKVSIDGRQAAYADLSERTQRIKESVKSQYGLQSTEFKLIKALKV